MSALTIALIVFVVITGAAALGTLLGRVLPEHHLAKESKEVINLGIGVIVTLTALVLGLLVASAKDAFDAKSDEIRRSSVKIVLLDQHLRRFGPAAGETRDLLRRWVDDSAGMIWATEGQRATTPQGAAEWEAFHDALSALVPTNEAQRSLQKKALDLADDVVQTRWLLIEQSDSAIQMPFLLVVVTWLAIIYASFGLFSPRNATVSTVIVLSALSLSTAVFLILELDRPFDGIILISDAPHRTMMKEFGR